jgi:hypothetical protein
VAGYAGGAQGKPAVGASDAITAAPWSDHDPYTDAALLDPWLGYKQLRDALRDVLRRPLTPRALRPVRDEVTAEVERLVEKLVAQAASTPRPTWRITFR